MVAQIRNRSGQMAVEMVLIIALTVGFAVVIGNEFQSRGFIAQLISRPWKSLAGMIQNGVWGPSQETMAMHPNSFRRVTTPEGEDVK